MDSVRRLGAAASLLVGLCDLASAAAFLLQPPEMRGAGSAEEFWSALARGAPAHPAVHWASAAAGIFGLVVALRRGGA